MDDVATYSGAAADRAAPARRSACRVCGAAAAAPALRVREMMFGTRREFAYERCEACGSLQIETVPSDLPAHYPQTYYAYGDGAPSPGARLRRRGQLELARAVVRAPSPAYRLLRALPAIGPRLRVHPLAPLRERLRGPGARSQRIADVGGGSGALLSTLRRLGFANLTCIDPYLRSPGERGGIRFVRAALADVDGSFDVIMYHHSVEHVLDLQAEFNAIARRLAPGGAFLLDVFVPDLTRFVRGQNVSAVRVELDGVMLDATRVDPVAQRVDTQHVVIAEEGIRLYPVRLRYAWPSELDLMARLAGLRLRERHGGWYGEPFTAASTRHVSIYEPA